MGTIGELMDLPGVISRLAEEVADRRQRMSLGLEPVRNDFDLLGDVREALDEAESAATYLQAILEGRADPADREQIASYLEYVAGVEVGTILSKQSREIVGMCAAWVRNRVDEREARRTAMASKKEKHVDRHAHEVPAKEEPQLPSVADLLFRRSAFGYHGFLRVEVTKEELAFLWLQKDWARLDPKVPYELGDWIAKDRRDGVRAEFLGVLRAGWCYERVVFLKPEDA